MVVRESGNRSKATIGKVQMDDLKAAVGKTVVVELFDGKKTSTLSGKLSGVDDFNTVTVELREGLYVIPHFIGKGSKIRTISSDEGVIYDNSRNVGKNLTKKGMTEDELLMLRLRSFGKQVTLEQEVESLKARVDFLDTLKDIIRKD